jgi:hypothetical protein
MIAICRILRKTNGTTGGCGWQAGIGWRIHKFKLSGHVTLVSLAKRVASLTTVVQAMGAIRCTNRSLQSRLHDLGCLPLGAQRQRNLGSELDDRIKFAACSFALQYRLATPLSSRRPGVGDNALDALHCCAALSSPSRESRAIMAPIWRRSFAVGCHRVPDPTALWDNCQPKHSPNSWCKASSDEYPEADLSTNGA